MPKTILITGSTDGIGLETAKILAKDGHRVLLHGRNQEKLEAADKTVKEFSDSTLIESYLADLANLSDVAALATAITKNHSSLDVLINNAGVFRTSNPITQDGLDVRFVVNTLAPYLLTLRLLPLLKLGSRVVNLSSAAQRPIDIKLLHGETKTEEEFEAYAQSKLALTMWTKHLAQEQKEKGRMIVSVNPGSLLATKMVREGFGMAGNDINIGSDILVRAALSEEFSNAHGLYYDNDTKAFADPHEDALDENKNREIMIEIERTIDTI